MSMHSAPFMAATKLLDAVLEGATGNSVNLYFPQSQFTCTVEWGGTAPTSTSVILQGSIDNRVWADLQTVSITSSGTMFHVINKPVKYIRAHFDSKVDGDATTTVTFICQAGIGGN